MIILVTISAFFIVMIYAIIGIMEVTYNKLGKIDYYNTKGCYEL